MMYYPTLRLDTNWNEWTVNTFIAVLHFTVAGRSSTMSMTHTLICIHPSDFW